MDFAKEFDALEKRAARLRITKAELIEKCGISVPTYWRAKKGLSGENAQLKNLRLVESIVAGLEREHKLCDLCGKRGSEVTKCSDFGCPHAKDQK